jgi:purine-binding chemotaxis protein CheW
MKAPNRRPEIHERANPEQSGELGNFAPPPDAQRRILKARARALACKPSPPIDPRELLEIVEFELAGERYGIVVTKIREVCTLKELTPVPCSPDFVYGIINLRGEIYTVIDLKRFFDLPECGLTELNQVLILDSEDMRVGILADTILGVRTIRLAALETSLPNLSGARATYLKGVTSERLAVLDAAKILSDEAILVHEEVGK